MRLTLRTLLAYIDEILEPNDAQEIGKKLEESEFATTLLHRIRDCLRRPRLPAPELGDEEKGLDANTVAEYLDNALPSDRVPDFERVCLESDVHLAEVASSHQILALVLGEPAEVDPASRQRMYELPQQATEAAAVEPPPVVATTGNGEALPHVDTKPHAEIPEYLLASREARRRSFHTVGAALLALAVLATCAAVFTGQFQPGSRLRRSLGIDPRLEARHDATTDAGTPAAVVDTTAADAAAVAASLPAPGDAPLVEEVIGPPTPGTTTPEATPTGDELPAVDDAAPPAVDAAPPAEDDAAPPGVDGMPAAVDDAAPPEPVPAAPVVGTAVDSPDAEAAPDPAAIAGADAAAIDAAAAGAGEAAAPAAPLPRASIGQLVSPSEAILRLDAKRVWQRMPGNAPLLAGEPLLSLPTFRPLVTLAELFRVQLIDNTRLEPLAPDADGTPGLAITHGRLVIAPEVQAQAIRLEVDDLKGVIRLVAPESSLAIEVTHGPASGDPALNPGPVILDLYVMSGKVLWQRGVDEAIAATAPVKLRLTEPPLEVAVTDFPEWVTATTASIMDQRAAGTVGRELRPDRPAELSLRELAGHRQKEIRWLAERCLGAMGDYGALVAALDDIEQRTAWPEYIEELRASVRRSPLAASQVRAAMEKAYGPKGVELYEMLWGYEKGVEPTKIQRLVDYLDTEPLAFRVLSFWILRNATGLSLYYRPEEPTVKRAPAVQKWRERLKVPAAQPSGDIEEAALDRDDTPGILPDLE